ncbi:hypothetical protein BS47DRAFT_1344135, partial [Hydnum rufescens UP504]
MAHPIRQPPMIVPAAVNYAAGFSAIYDLTLFSNGNQQPHYGGEWWPLPEAILPNPFPFTRPPWFDNVDTSLRFHTLSKSAYSTNAKSTTATASAIQDLGQQQQLGTLRVSNELAIRLAQYGRGPGRLPQADRTEQAHAIHGLWVWYQSHCWPSRNDVVNGEPSVQDQVFKQVISVMNIYIQSRYRNLQPAAHQLLPPDEQEPRGYYPIWRRAVAYRSHCWEGDSPAHKLVKQVWGEMHFFQCHWGVWTNGEVFIFMIRTNITELTCSRPIPWSDTGAFTAMIGFTLASIDAKTDVGLAS